MSFVEIQPITSLSENHVPGIADTRQLRGCIHRHTLLFDDFVDRPIARRSEAVEQLELGWIGGRVIDDPSAYFNPGVAQKWVCTVPNHDFRLDSVGAQNLRGYYGTLQTEQRLPIK
jgi:hypothetical protein